MRRRIVAQSLIERLNEKIGCQIDFRKALILGVVLKGLPIAFGLAKMNMIIENFVPIIAQRHIYMQHHVESYFPSQEWKTYFCEKQQTCDSLLIVDDVVNTGFTKQRVESILHGLDSWKANSRRFAALVLNRKNLANPNFVSDKDVFAMKVTAKKVECDWGLLTVPLWDLPVEVARKRCERYYNRFWLNEERRVTITY